MARLLRAPLLLTSCVLAGCAAGPKNPIKDAPPLTQEQQQAATSLAKDVNGFSFSLTKEIAEQNPTGNILLSPISAEIVLASLLHGAGASDQARLLKSLSVEASDAKQAGRSFYALQHSLVNVPNDPVTIGNSLWFKSGITPKQAFIDASKRDFLSDVFPNKPFDQSTVGEMNSWVDQNTMGRIPKIIEEIDPQEAMFLINAVTFTGKWDEPFERDATQPGQFTNGEGKKVDAQYMKDSRDTRYSAKDGVRAISLPYQGKAYRMIMVLPAEGTTPAAWLSKTTPESWAKLKEGMFNKSVKLQLPKFKFKGDYSLKNALSQLGLSWIFESINLSGISDAMERQFVSRVLQRTMIEVDEEGTKAAAATIGAVAAGIEMDPPEFIATRPFFYAIEHEQTGAILFMGICADPTDEGR